MVDRPPHRLPPGSTGHPDQYRREPVDHRGGDERTEPVRHNGTNGHRVNGAGVPAPPLAHPAEGEQADAEFWFGAPLPEAALPPLEDVEPPHTAQPPHFTPSGPWPGPRESPPADQTWAASVPVSDRLAPGWPVDPSPTGSWPSPDPSRQRTEPLSRRDLLPVPPEDTGPTEIIPAIRVEDPRDEPRPRDEPTEYQPSISPPDGPDDRTPPTPADGDLDDGDFDEDDLDDGERPRHGKHRRDRRHPLWRELLTLVGVALLLTFLIQHFVGRVYSIPSGSMEQTLHGCPGCTGDRVFVDKMVYDFRDPTPGDVVVFEGPNSWTGQEVVIDPSNDNPVLDGLRYLGSLIGIAPPDERDFVKRVIAVGGQTVECCDEQNRVMVDGRPLDEPYVYWEDGEPDERQRFEPVTVPEGTLWVMGDNRANSADSRIQGGGGIRGVVPLTKVIGKARYIVLPPSRWQGVGDHNPQRPQDLAAPAWQQGVPAGIGLAAAWPVLWLGRRAKNALTRRKAD